MDDVTEAIVLDLLTSSIVEIEYDFGEALKNQNSLTDIDLTRKQIGDNGAKALGEALKNNNSLTKIDLSYNNICVDGAKALGEALKNNNSLTKIYLSGNNIGVNGAKALVEALKNNNFLTRIDLSYIPNVDFNTVKNVEAQINSIIVENKILAEHTSLSKGSLTFYIDGLHTYNESDDFFYWRQIKEEEKQRMFPNEEKDKIEGGIIWQAAKGSGKALKVFHQLLKDFLDDEISTKESLKKKQKTHSQPCQQ
eukprot:CAMPEP_0185740912 /NCGR_PEP_ID=MMETSP1171-20130828/38675_1 /TAXON_ID=374046 /ORGANISM="Helicotheca tamensis, Strain CCMP826" /LENGTH=251 /DNA_ID=CAMNT_0028412843 /DNA_START=255 /DNA_END=1010 /DNA_ORIENTATION=+